MKQVESGFSLIELLMVIALLAIMSAIALPSYIVWTKSVVYKNASHEILSLMRDTRSRAISNNREAKLEIDLRNQSKDDPSTCRIYLWDLGTSDWGVTPAQTATLSKVGVLTSDNASGLCGSVGTTESIVFRPNGSIRTSVSTPKKYFCVVDETGARRKHVMIDSFATGRATIE